MFIIDGLEFSKEEVEKALTQLEYSVHFAREQILKGVWNSSTYQENLKRDSARIEFLKNALSEAILNHELKIQGVFNPDDLVINM